MSILDLFDSILDLGVYIWASRYRLCPDFGARLGGVNFRPLRFDFRLEGIYLGLQVSTLSRFWGPRDTTVQDWTFESRLCAFGT